jgi:hypothetical protein
VWILFLAEGSNVYFGDQLTASDKFRLAITGFYKPAAPLELSAT